ncbi:MAG: 5'-methylthioadenosine/adenosylhomocysteine nucleosidase [Gammaproteobacteria bacterium]|nr:5'-methylthioadenosine/adenosylhomocysteine nucleosidase [Gammaproteobacteria bacterium]
MTIAIMSAMHEENASLLSLMHVDSSVDYGGRTFHEGMLFDKPAVLVFSHWGKVAAATTATSLITRFGVSEVLFTGVAGAIAPQVSIGDVVVAENLYQHDMDARPMIAQHEIPLLKRRAIATDSERRDRLQCAAHDFLANDLSTALNESSLEQFSLNRPQVFVGDIASGDQFVSDPNVSSGILHRLPSVLCVEMEGAAVAQVCDAFNIPFTVVRTISDGANSSSSFDFLSFVESVATAYSQGIVERYLAG